MLLSRMMFSQAEKVLVVSHFVLTLIYTIFELGGCLLTKF